MPAETLWSRLSWPQVAALAVIVTGAVVAVVFVPAETWSALPWESIAGIAAVVLGAGASATMHPILRPRGSSVPPAPVEPPKTPPRPTMPPSRRGFADVELLRWVLFWGGVWLLAIACSTLSGCGAAAVVKPILDTTCAAARVTCTLIDSACSAYEGTSGSEAPSP